MRTIGQAPTMRANGGGGALPEIARAPSAGSCNPNGEPMSFEYLSTNQPGLKEVKDGRPKET